MNNSDYIYADARVKYRERSLLSDNDIAQMVSLDSGQAVLEFLISRGWGSSGMKDPEEVLDAEEKKTLDLMTELKLDPHFLEVLAYPKLFHNLKAGIKEIVTSDPHPKAFYPLETFGRDQMLKILKEKTYSRLPEDLREIAPKAFEAMLRTRDGQTVDMMVDRACLQAMEKAGLQSDCSLFRTYLTNTVAVVNIKIAARCQKMGKDKDFLLSALAPCSLLDVEQLAAAAAGKPEDLLGYLRKNGFTGGAEALSHSFASFERFCDDRLMDSLRTQHDVYDSPGPVVAYYLAREAEISNARVILTGKANGLSREAIQERVRRMYV